MSETNLQNTEISFRRSGRSGLELPVVSLGLWHNFGAEDCSDKGRQVVAAAWDSGITHFDLANNYGPPPGSAEEAFGRLISNEFAAHRDGMVISTKAGYRMTPGPYGDGGSRKYLLSSLEASLRRLRLDRVDIFYHHRPDPDTPLEETMGALASAVHSGKALYAGISNYDPGRTLAAVTILKSLGAPCVIHQVRYNIFDRRPEPALFSELLASGVGCIVFSPLDQGILAGKYLSGIPADSRAARPNTFLKPEQVTSEKNQKAQALDALARARGQTLAQLSLAWVLRQKAVTSALIGASSPDQIRECVAALQAPALGDDELSAIDKICEA